MTVTCYRYSSCERVVKVARDYHRNVTLVKAVLISYIETLVNSLTYLLGREYYIIFGRII